MLRDNTTLLIAGLCDSVGYDNIPIYKKFCKNIVISTWKNQPALDKYEYKYRNDKSIKIIKSDTPPYPKTTEHFCKKHKYTDKEGRYASSVYYQFYGMYLGLKHCNSRYVIRTRSNERFSNLLPLMQQFSRNVDGLCHINAVSNFFSDGHISDHLFMAKTKTLLKTYSSLCYKIFKNEGLDTHQFISPVSNIIPYLKRPNPNSGLLDIPDGQWLPEDCLATEFLCSLGYEYDKDFKRGRCLTNNFKRTLSKVSTINTLLGRNEFPVFSVSYIDDVGDFQINITGKTANSMYENKKMPGYFGWYKLPSDRSCYDI